MVTNNCFRTHSGLPTEPEQGREEVVGKISSQTSQCHAISTEPKTLAQELGSRRPMGRDYLPGIGRFLARVRLQEQLLGEHPYTYGNSNPILHADPAGNSPIVIFGGGGVIVVGGGIAYCKIYGTNIGNDLEDKYSGNDGPNFDKFKHCVVACRLKRSPVCKYLVWTLSWWKEWQDKNKLKDPTGFDWDDITADLTGEGLACHKGSCEGLCTMIGYGPKD